MLTVGFYFLYIDPAVDTGDIPDVGRFILANVIVLMFLFAVPCWFRKMKNKQYGNYFLSLFFLVLETFAFFALFFLGVSLLLLSIDFLFSVNVDEELYMYAFSILTGIFAVPYFLGHLPSEPKEFELDKGSVRFEKSAKYFLGPLVFMYLIVLYIYSGNILMSGTWPEGTVANWIIGFSFVGVVTFFMTVFANAKNSYLQHYKKWFFPVLLPLIGMLFWSLWIRYEEFGLTEMRYIVALFSVWLLVSAFYFIIADKKGKLIFFPSSFLILLLIATWGPINMFDLSAKSQLNELKEAKLNLNDSRVSSLRWYLRDRGYEEEVNDILGEDYVSKPYVSSYRKTKRVGFDSRQCYQNCEGFLIDGYSYLSGFRASVYDEDAVANRFVFNDNDYVLSAQKDGFIVFNLLENDEEVLLGQIDIEDLVASNGSHEKSYVYIPFEAGEFVIDQYNVVYYEDNNEMKSYNVSGYILIK